MKRIKIINFVLIMFLLSLNLVTFTFGKYTSTVNRKVYLNIGTSSYMVVFHTKT